MYKPQCTNIKAFNLELVNTFIIKYINKIDIIINYKFLTLNYNNNYNNKISI